MSRFWFAKNDPSKYRDIYDKINIFEYYQKFVGDYEEVMRGWGYCVPEVTVDAIEKFGGVADRCEMQLHIGTVHKGRPHREGGRGVPQKQT